MIPLQTCAKIAHRKNAVGTWQDRLMRDIGPRQIASEGTVLEYTIRAHLRVEQTFAQTAICH